MGEPLLHWNTLANSGTCDRVPFTLKLYMTFGNDFFNISLLVNFSLLSFLCFLYIYWPNECHCTFNDKSCKTTLYYTTTLFSKRSAHEHQPNFLKSLGHRPRPRAIFDKFGMTRGRGQWLGVTRRTGWNQCALLLEKSVLQFVRIVQQSLIWPVTYPHLLHDS